MQPDAAGGTRGDAYPSVSPDGRTLAFARGDNWVCRLFVLAVTQDLQPAGEPVRVTDQRYGNIMGIAWTADGRELVYAAGIDLQSLWRVSVSGGQAPKRVPYVTPGASFPAIARGRPRLAYTWRLANLNLWRLDIRTRQRRMLIGSTYRSVLPEYSPDGRKIAFESNRSGNDEIWTCEADGSNCLQLTSCGGPLCGTPRWSPDGHWIAFDGRLEGSGESYVIAADGGIPRRVSSGSSKTGVQNYVPAWSADGRWLYFTSDRSGHQEIWKIPVEGGQAVRVTRSGGAGALSSPDGKYLYYVKPDAPGLFRVPLDGGDEKQVLSRPVSWDAFCVTGKGVYFRDGTDGTIGLLDAATGAVRTVAVVDKRFFSGLCVSPDDAYVVWSQVDRDTTDLMLVENFR